MNTHFQSSEQGPDAPKGCPVQAIVLTRVAGQNNRAALAAKRPIPPRVAGRNPGHHAEPRFGGDSVDGVVGSLNQDGAK